MPITKRTYGDVYRDGKKRLVENTPITNFGSSSIAKAYLDITGTEIERIYDTINYVYQASDPTVAIGKDLDNNGFLVGKNRLTSVVAADFTYTNFYFQVDPRLNWSIQKLIEQNYTAEEQQVLIDKGLVIVNGTVIESLVIPVGTIVSNTSNSISYTTSDIAILTGTQPGYTPIIATYAGSDSNVQSNVLVSHNINSIIELRKISHLIKCYNTFPIQNGRYTQSDEEFRYSISIAGSAKPTNEIEIRTTALSVPGVRDILFERNKYGNGTVHIIIDSVSPLVSNGLIQAVNERINHVASGGDKIYVSAPEYISIGLTFFIDVDTGIENDTLLRQQAKSEIIQYINDLPIGGEIVWNEIITRVVAIEGIKDFIPTLFKSGIYDSINKISSKEIVLRFINQKSKYNQKFYTDQSLIRCCS